MFSGTMIFEDHIRQLAMASMDIFTENVQLDARKVQEKKRKALLLLFINATIDPATISAMFFGTMLFEDHIRQLAMASMDIFTENVQLDGTKVQEKRRVRASSNLCDYATMDTLYGSSHYPVLRNSFSTYPFRELTHALSSKVDLGSSLKRKCWDMPLYTFSSIVVFKEKATGSSLPSSSEQVVPLNPPVVNDTIRTPYKYKGSN
ncbi:hypothetical protein POM88_032778 [Heracleum sosnowskyi]|uniref:Uncharacterized protein n=1 Tax=Heracleum sosnowskyi TaxID=360622 RepID=A0AAD8I2W1_9APIA|nr:hypothetical protein POM88_032778 [Heracleum sosnowskyi]